ncbi:hypothetical protein BDZ97DRAFT_1922926 [Flammula alnicola]|nr:hypothetical protein BDZ97DRAFT_1922926 [Flammula alnicola]
MPEVSALRVAEAAVYYGKGSGLSRREVKNLQFYFIAIPATHEPNHKTLTADSTEFNIPTHYSNVHEDPRIEAPQSSVQHSPDEDWRYLTASSSPGALTCVTRGNLMVMAAGHHAVVMNLGLEGNVIGMPHEIYREIIANDYPDPNSESGGRTFKIPDRFIVQHSSPIQPRTIKLYAAFVSDRWVWAIADHLELLKMHVKSRDTPWCRSDFEVGSSTWYELFNHFRKGGPDWVLERPLASAKLDAWRHNIVREYNEYQVKVTEALKLQPEPDRTQKEIDGKVVHEGHDNTSLFLPLEPPNRYIIREICNNYSEAFSGFGRHTANDFLYHLAIFPGTPAYVVCTDDELYEEFKVSLYSYQAKFSEPYYLRVASRQSTATPFEFNENMNMDYISRWVNIFRRTTVLVPKDLYMRYMSQGLFDPEHTIGHPYVPNRNQVVLDKLGNRIQTQVLFYHKPLKAYTIIKARPPQSWGLADVDASHVKKDIKGFEYVSTIGMTQSYAHLLNRVRYRDVEVATGRPSTEKGRPGRPRKTLTKKSLKRLRSAQTDRKSHAGNANEDGHVSLDDHEDEDFDDNPGSDYEGNVEAEVQAEHPEATRKDSAGHAGQSGLMDGGEAQEQQERMLTNMEGTYMAASDATTREISFKRKRAFDESIHGSSGEGSRQQPQSRSKRAKVSGPSVESADVARIRSPSSQESASPMDLQAASPMETMEEGALHTLPADENKSPRLSLGTDPPLSRHSNEPEALAQMNSKSKEKSDELPVAIESISPAPPRGWLKEAHMSISFVEVSGFMLCRLCVTSKTHVFRVKPGLPHTPLAMQGHYEKEHPDECAALMDMSDDDLRELQIRLNPMATPDTALSVDNNWARVLIERSTDIALTSRILAGATRIYNVFLFAIMLNPPLSLLSDDLIAYIVEHVAELAFRDKNLCNLSLADRAFTQFCQTHIFRTLALNRSSGTKNGISKELEKTRKILNDKPSFANRVRVFKLAISHNRNAWLFNDPTLISILQLLAKSPIPPHKLHFGGHSFSPFTLEAPILVVGRLMQSFFSQTLTILHLTQCQNVPLPLFLICPRLREMLLDHVGVTEESYDNYPDEQCSGRESPALELFDCRDSQSLVKQMITPPPRFHTPVVLWSKLRFLTLSPHEKEEMTCLQPILDMACSTLEELYLTNLRVDDDEQLSLARLVNLSGLSHLHVFALNATIKCDVPGSGPPRYQHRPRYDTCIQ